MTLQFVLTFLGMMIMGSVGMTGWFAITRGRIDFSIDGVPFKTGKLFNGWHFFWTQGDKNAKIVSGKPLVDIYLKIRDKVITTGLNSTNTMILVCGSEKLDLQYLSSLAGCKCIVNDQSTGLYFKKEFTEYFFPEWIRDPVSECPTCMASVYGSIIYWTMLYYSNDLFTWCNANVGAEIFSWVLYCIGCAFLNTVLAKKL